MKHRFFICAATFILASGLHPSGFAAATGPHDVDWVPAEQILQRIYAPVFPDRVFDIRDYEAVADGKTDNTEAIREAIEECSASGGGRVLVPAGLYATGAIHLKSNVDLHVSEGATLLFSTNPHDYLPVVFTRWEGVECMSYSSFIYAFEQENIAVTGTGTLDGQASNENWWPWNGRDVYGWKEGTPNQRAARDRLLSMGENGIPVSERIMGNESYLRPNFIQPYRCKNVLIEGITIRNSPMWEVHPVLCTNVTVSGLTIVSHGPNNDGCNPESCKDVLIEDCLFDTGDDCIAIKSGRNNDGRRLNTPSENIVIRNCSMKDGHGGVVIGSEVAGGCRNVYVEDCSMSSPNLDRALRIKTNSVRGGLIENIYLRNIEVGEVKDAVFKVNFEYEEGDVGEFTPIVRNVLIRNLRSGSCLYPLSIQGYERSPIRNIRLVDCDFTGAEKPSVLNHVAELTLENVSINSGAPLDRRGNPLDAFGNERPQAK